MDKRYYTVGFLFNKDRTKVALIEKDRPIWQAGMINGIGGKFEPELDNDLEECMEREFREECGLNIYKKEWNHFCTMQSLRNNYEVHCFRAFVDDETLSQIKQVESEVPIICNVKNLPDNCIVNLYHLIPMAIYMEKNNCKNYVLTEEYYEN